MDLRSDVSHGGSRGALKNFKEVSGDFVKASGRDFSRTHEVQRVS